MKLKSLIGSGIIVGSLAVSSVAGAAVAIDPLTGEGFVGKGDVKYSTGLTEKQIQAGVSVDFTSVSSQDFEVVCRKNEGQGRTRVRRVDRTDVTESVQRELDSRGRENPKGKITGYVLEGFGDVISSTGVPEEGDSCDGVDESTGVAFTDGKVASVTPVEDTATGPVFYVNGDLLQEAPVA